jgi:hypothetical protein
MDTLRSLVRQVITEGKRETDLVDFVFRLRVRTEGDNDPQITDIMTNIRIIKGVAIARQVMPVRRIKGARDVLQIGVKYMPDNAELGDTIEFLGTEIKAVDGVEIAMLLTVGGREVRKENGDPYIY